MQSHRFGRCGDRSLCASTSLKDRARQVRCLSTIRWPYDSTIVRVPSVGILDEVPKESVEPRASWSCFETTC